MSKRKQKFPNQTVERLTALRGILNMQERAIAKGKACKLNGVSRNWDMSVWDCGTASCAWGSAALNPWFKERGVSMKSERGLFEIRMTPVYKEETGEEAGALFFGISLDEALRIFDGDGYSVSVEEVTPTMVRDRVDALIAKYSTVQP